MTQQSESQAMAHEATLFVMQMAGDSMINAGIHNGDLLIVDRSLAPVPGDVVAAVMDDEIAIKRLVSRAGITILHAENPRYPDYMPSNGASFPTIRRSSAASARSRACQSRSSASKRATARRIRSRIISAARIPRVTARLCG